MNDVRLPDWKLRASRARDGIDEEDDGPANLFPRDVDARRLRVVETRRNHVSGRLSSSDCICSAGRLPMPTILRAVKVPRLEKTV